MENITLTINNRNMDIVVAKNWTLLYVLRELLDLTGAKCGCNTGDCGACKVIMDGEAINSCLVLAHKAQGHSIVTIEGLANDGILNPIQQAFIDCGAIQCGYCTPGMVLSAKALLDKNFTPTEEDIRAAIDNNLCRCTGYVKIVEAIKRAAELMHKGG